MTLRQFSKEFFGGNNESIFCEQFNADKLTSPSITYFFVRNERADSKIKLSLSIKENNIEIGKAYCELGQENDKFFLSLDNAILHDDTTKLVKKAQIKFLDNNYYTIQLLYGNTVISLYRNETKSDTKSTS